MEGILHTYHPGRNLLLFEHTPKPPPSSPDSAQTTPTATLLFIGGMYDNFLVPAYTAQLAHLFPRHSTQRWAVMHVQLSSAGKSFGSSDLDRDIDEIATCINFIRGSLRRTEPAHNIVIMGHSTGCQDVLHYLYAPNPTISPISNRPLTTRPPVQGAILQAPVSDREAALHTVKESQLQSNLKSALDICNSTPHPSHRDTYLPLTLTRPLYGPAPQTISRFLSLISPDSPANPGPDDLFSSDLPDSRLKTTFGHIARNNLLIPPQPPHLSSSQSRSLLILMSEGDADYTPTSTQTALLDRWRAATSARGPITVHASSAVIRNAVHDASGDDEARVAARVDLLGRVLDYIDEAVGGVDPEAWRLLRGELEAGDRGLVGAGGQNEGIGGLEKDVGDVKL